MIFRRNFTTFFTLLIAVILTAACGLTKASGPVAPSQADAPAGKRSAESTSSEVIPQTGLEPAPTSAPVIPRPTADGTLGRKGLAVLNPAGYEHAQLTPVDLASGMPIPGYAPVDLGSVFVHAFSPDRKELAVFGKGADCPDGCFLRVDLAHWQVVDRRSLDLLNGSEDWPFNLVYNRQGTRIAFLTNGAKSRLAVVETTGSRSLHWIDLPVLPKQIAFTTDGQSLMVVGGAPIPDASDPFGLNQETRALRVDLANLQIEWNQVLAGVQDGQFGPDGASEQDFAKMVYRAAAIVAAPGRNVIYIAHADHDRLTTVDFDAKTVRTVTVGRPRSLVERLAEALLSIGVQPVQAKAGNMTLRQGVLSPDGHLLYLVGQHSELVPQEGQEPKFVQNYLGLQVWDVEKGVLVAQQDHPATEIRFAPNGQLLLTYWEDNDNNTTVLPRTIFVDPATLRAIDEVRGIYAITSLRLDGTPMLVSTSPDDRGNTVLSVLSPDSHRPITQWSAGYQNGSYWLELK